MTVPHLIRRAAIVEGRTLTCPHCGSADVAYAQDMRLTFPILRVDADAELIMLGEDVEPGETKDEWIQCRSCLRASQIPEDLAVGFEEV
jgi:DNA-directed RNA polymerase subunit RPC12/RpoP